MAAKGAGGLDWQADGLCAQPENQHKWPLFFSAKPERRYEAKALCAGCPVRGDCVKWALENGEIWGIWGGRDENEIRRTLSVNADGNEIRRGRFPQCPYCSARTSRLKTKIIDLPDGGRWQTARVVECTDCGFEWRSRSSANAVNAYFAERQDRRDRRDKKRAAAKPRPSIKQLPSTGRLPDLQNGEAL